MTGGCSKANASLFESPLRILGLWLLTAESPSIALGALGTDSGNEEEVPEFLVYEETILGAFKPDLSAMIWSRKLSTSSLFVTDEVKLLPSMSCAG